MKSGWQLTAAVLLGIAAFFSPAAAQKPAADADCLECHGDSAIDEGLPAGRSLLIDAARFSASVHNSIACVDCHVDATAPHDQLPTAACADCHDDAAQAWGQGTHRPETEGAPGCVTCHTSHAVQSASDPASPTHHLNQHKLCGECHGKTTRFVVEEPWLQRQRPFFAFQQGVHGRALAAGRAEAATCTDCHRPHDVRPPSDPASPIYRTNVPATCGQCHIQETQHFLLSVHGQAALAGAQDAPVCTSCHGIHAILSRLDPGSPIASQQIARTTCPRCHAGVRLSREYGTPAGRVNTFMDSYHGLAGQRGSKEVANCASCHGVHEILPSVDPRSSIAPANLSATCGSCHPGASDNFARVPVHGPPAEAGIASVAAEWVRTAYLWLIALTVFFFLLINGSDFARQLRLHLRRQLRRGVVRFGRGARWQHLLLLLSFVLLALTGFALRFPDAWWARALLPVSEETRSTLHRISGLVLIAIALIHALTLGGRGGRSFLGRVRPGLTDVRELRQQLAFNILGGKRRQPREGWFGMREKLEYWSVVWGTVVMAVTGLVLWFEREAMVWIAAWIWDVCSVIHYYEAWLAVLAILFGHFYSVIFDPRVYPLDGSFLHGQRSRRRARGMIHHSEKPSSLD